MKYVIDTDWIIHGLRGEQRVVRKLLSIKKDGLAISMASLAELYEGIFRSSKPAKDERVLQDFLSGVTILEIDQETCKDFGRQRARLRKDGHLIGDLDILIAATCIQHRLTLLTDNIRDFERIEDLKIFRGVEN